MTLSVEGGFDGGNPQDPAAIEYLAAGHVRVAPSSEDGDANYKFALNVRVTNSTSSSLPLTLEVEWHDHEYMADRCFVHVGVDERWEYVPARVEASRTVVERLIPPGTTSIGVSPAYGWETYRAFAAGLPRGVLRHEVLGRSAQGREIEAFRAGDGPERVLVMARAHPYETAGSFAVEGLLAWLSSAGAAQQALLAACRLTVLPMANPDGVALGLCKRTAPHDGADPSRDMARRDDATMAALLRCIDALRPARLLDLHGWMWFNEDGLFDTDDMVQRRFVAALPEGDALATTRWRAHRLAQDDATLLGYCARAFGTASLEVSLRWPGRSVAQMRDAGATALQAFCAP